MKVLDEMEFPAEHVFKIVGNNDEIFRSGVEHVFAMEKIVSKKENLSRSGNYVSISVTANVADKDHLLDFYSRIKQIDGIKYHL